MKLGVLTVPLYALSLEETLKYLSGLGVTAVEIGTGGYPGDGHSHREELLTDKSKLKTFRDTIEKYGFTISALSTHGNAVHPDKAVADKFQYDFERTCLLANELGIDRVVTFSGCPGDAPGAKNPNWVTCPWPEEFTQILDYQWNDVLIPYWTKTVEYAKKYGVDKIALEMHPGFCVYNPESLIKLRNAAGKEIGANFDPSHLLWQGIDPVEAIRYLGKQGAIYHFHAKDTKIDATNTAVNGVLDVKHYGDELNRSWVFRSVGYGNDMQKWRDIVSMLRLVGYDHVMSIEHEDSLMTGNEGLEKAIDFLKQAMIFEPKPREMFWA